MASTVRLVTFLVTLKECQSYRPLEVKVKFSRKSVGLFEIPWTVACPAPLSMEFSRQEYWSGLPFPSPRIFPTQGLNLGFLHCRQVLYQFFTAWEGIPTHRWQNEFQFINQKTQSCEQSKLLLVLPLDFSSLVGSPWWRTQGQTGGLWFVPSSCHSRLLALRGFFSLLSIWPWA